MSIAVLYLVSVTLFLVLDALGLRFIVKPVFDQDIGHLLRETPSYGPAVIFYLFYVLGLLWFVSLPALRDDSGLLRVFLLGCFFGAIGYGTYEFSNMATLQGWSWKMVLTDLVWGTLLTGTVAAGGVAITRAVT